MLGIEYKISLFADNLLIYLTDPLFHAPKVLQILGDFFGFSGSKLNFTKSMFPN